MLGHIPPDWFLPVHTTHRLRLFHLLVSSNVESSHADPEYFFVGNWAVIGHEQAVRTWYLWEWNAFVFWHVWKMLVLRVFFFFFLLLLDWILKVKVYVVIQHYLTDYDQIQLLGFWKVEQKFSRMFRKLVYVKGGCVGDGLQLTWDWWKVSALLWT